MLDLSKNYFELFGLPVNYIIDSEQLSKHYRELQRVLHPDRFANASAQERRISMQGATQINEAHQTLKDPILRARYLLSLKGLDMDDLQQETTQDTAFLMEQLELRESLEQARHASDPYHSISTIMTDVGRRMEKLIGEVALQFEASAQDALEKAREIVRKMQFLQKLQHDAESLEAELDEK